MFPEPAAGLSGLRVAVEAVQPKAVVTTGIGHVLRLLFPELRRLKPLPGLNGKEPGREILAHLPGDAPALITFTSGSTGRPKGIVRRILSAATHAAGKAAPDCARRYRPDLAAGVYPVEPCSRGDQRDPGCRLTRPAKLSGAALRKQMLDHRVNRIVAPPVVVARITEGAEPIPLLEAVFTGGGPVFPNLLHAVARALPERQSMRSTARPRRSRLRIWSSRKIGAADWEAMANGAGLLAGTPIPEIEVDIRDHEVFVAGPHVNQGYLDPADDKSTKSVSGGKVWHRTGDAARRDEHGRLWLLGRREAASGGLFPFAIETAALSWSGVRQAALLAGDGRAKLALSGDGLDLAALQKRAGEVGPIDVVILREVPMDKRHNSKADYARLRKLLA